MTVKSDRNQHSGTTSATHIACDCEFVYRSGFKLDVNFKSSEMVTAVTGPSGSGKTTLLFLIAGLLRPTRGNIRLEGGVVFDCKNRVFVPPHDRRVGFLFQQLYLFPAKRVAANLKYGWRRRSPACPQGQKPVEFDHVVETLEIENVLNRSITSLSRGQQQRVALGRAILSHPNILLLDEPFTAVEEALRDRIAELIERVVQEFRIPIVLVSHNEQMVTRLANQHIALIEGRVA